jgi:hypothetical protein
MTDQPSLFEPARPHARRTDPVTSDRAVKAIAQDGTLASLIWLHAQCCREADVLMNDSELTEWMERATCQRQQRNVVARARGLMEDGGLLRQAGVHAYQGRDLMHYEIDPANPKENP